MTNREEKKLPATIGAPPGAMQTIALLPREHRMAVWGPAFAERVKTIKDFYAWSAREMSSRCRFTPNQITNFITNGTGAQWDMLLSMVYCCGVNPEWILTGIGESGLSDETRARILALPPPVDEENEAESVRLKKKGDRAMQRIAKKIGRTDRPVGKPLTKEVSRSQKGNKTSPT